MGQNVNPGSRSQAMKMSKVECLDDYRSRKSNQLRKRIEMLQSLLIQAVIALEFPKKRIDEVGVAQTERIYDRMVADIRARLAAWVRDA